MATQKKWISDRFELMELVKSRVTAMKNPYSYFPYDYKMDFIFKLKIEVKRKEVLGYDSYFKLDITHIKILI